jgi:hypothetical protein
MITSPNANLIQSDEGFSVDVLGGGRLGMVYREGSLAVKVLSETAILPTGYIIYRNSIVEWAPPGGGAKIDAASRERIIDRLKRGFAVQGYSIEINSSTPFREEVLRKLQKLP